MEPKLAKEIIDAIQWTKADKEGIAYKQLAISLLTGSIRDYGGKFVPKFTEIAELLGMPKETLHNWWQDREEILDNKSDALLDHLTDIAKEKVKIALTITISEILIKLQNPDTMAAMSMRELLMIQKQLMSDDRMLNGTGRKGKPKEGNGLYIPFKKKKNLPDNTVREVIIEPEGD